MSFTAGATLTVVQPGAGDTAEIPGFGAVFKLTGRTTGGLVSIVGELLASAAGPGPDSPPLHTTAEFVELSNRYGLTYGKPQWFDDIVTRYHLNPPTH